MSLISASHGLAPVLDTGQIVTTRLRLYEQIRDFFVGRQTPEANIAISLQTAITDNMSYYQISQVVSEIDSDRKHASEFSLLTWSLPHIDLSQLMHELKNLLSHITSQLIEIETLSYKQAFLRRLDINPLTADIKILKNTARRVGLQIELGDSRVDWLHLLFSQFIEPTLGINQPVYLTDFPIEFAKSKQIQIDEDGLSVATCADLYLDGLKVASLNDSIKVGLDRLLMVLLDIRRIDRVIIN